jgi:DNA helicase-2/ATP-dependent DNA helicase PcrA
MIELRQGQREVAAYRGGLLAVPAVPGAGKTTVLAYLASQLIEEGCIGKGKILIVTYMTSSVANFKARIADFLEKKGLPKTKGYEVRTLHSLAINILKERPDRILLQEELQVIDELDQDRIVKNFTHVWIEGHFEVWKSVIKTPEKSNSYERHLEGWKKETIKLVKDMIRQFKSSGISAREAGEKTAHLPESSFLRWCAQIYGQYQQWLIQAGAVDFEDMIFQAASLLREDKELLARLQARWSYIFEDEAQDSNPLQEEILKLLAGEGGNLLRVGDSNQAIMGTFTNAEPELFRRFCRSAATQPILMASRSSRDIIAVANHLVEWAGSFHPEVSCREALAEQHICPVPPEDRFPNPAPQDYLIAAPNFASDTEEIQKICRHAVNYAANNPLKTLAILAPADYILQEVADTLTGMGVNFYELTRLPRERQRTAEDLDAIVRFLARPQDNARFMFMLARLIPALTENENHALRCWLEQEYLEEMFYAQHIPGFLPELPVEFTALPISAEMKDVLINVRDWLAAVYLSPDALILYIADHLALCREEREIAARMALDIRSRLEQNPALRLDTLLLEMDAVKNTGHKFANIVFERRGYTPKPGVINLVTCHKSKGLEWDMVYVIGTTAVEYPTLLQDKIRSEIWFLHDYATNPSALAKAELRAVFFQDVCRDPLTAAKTDVIGERLRLLYVAITRARESLVLSTHRLTNKYNKKVQPAAAYEALRQHIDERRTAR